MDAARIFDRPPPVEPEPELDADDLRALLRTSGVRRDVRAAARLFGALSPTQRRRTTKRAVTRLGGYGPEPTARDEQAAAALGLPRLRPRGSWLGRYVSKRRRSIVRR
jgi:hypothetical protein